eukprot:gene25893-11566_t
MNSTCTGDKQKFSNTYASAGPASASSRAVRSPTMSSNGTGDSWSCEASSRVVRSPTMNSTCTGNKQKLSNTYASAGPVSASSRAVR